VHGAGMGTSGFHAGSNGLRQSRPPGEMVGPTRLCTDSNTPLQAQQLASFVLLLLAAFADAAPAATGCRELGFTETLVCSKCDRYFYYVSSFFFAALPLVPSQDPAPSDLVGARAGKC